MTLLPLRRPGRSRPRARDPRTDSYPMSPYPTGWYALLRSRELRPGKIKSLTYFGRSLIAYRGADGTATVRDAHCPHYGADLGVRSKMVDGTVECPFHGWRFDGEGRCVLAPFADRPPKVRLGGLITREASGLILVWNGPGEPTWEVPEIPEASDPRFGEPSSELFTARIHIQEMRENIVDEAHFHHIHRQARPPRLDFQPDGPLALVPSRIHRNVLGVELDNTFDAHMYGPGIMRVVVHGTYFSLTTVALTTPLDATTSQMRLLNYVAKPAKAPFLQPALKAAFRLGALAEVRHEVAIWDEKVHLEKPVFLQHETAIKAFRRWYAQFYETTAP